MHWNFRNCKVWNCNEKVVCLISSLIDVHFKNVLKGIYTWSFQPSIPSTCIRLSSVNTPFLCFCVFVCVPVREDVKLCEESKTCMFLLFMPTLISLTLSTACRKTPQSCCSFFFPFCLCTLHINWERVWERDFSRGDVTSPEDV